MSNLSKLDSLKTFQGNALDLANKTYASNLDQLDCLIVTGKDARSFLQGQVTCDMNLITPDFSLPGTHCTNKGRAVFSFRAIQLLDTSNDSNELQIALIIPKELSNTALNALSKFIVFSKATLTKTEDYKMLGIFGKNTDSIVNSIQNFDGSTQHISVLKVEENQTILLAKQSTLDVAIKNLDLESVVITHFSDWQLTNIRHGIADIYKGASELFLPQMLNFDNNGGISYKKGCYIGQEIVARMHHKGKLKRHLRRVALNQCEKTPSPGTDIYSDQSTQSVGHVVFSASTKSDTFEVLIIVTDDAFDSQNIYLDQEKALKLHPLSLPYAINN